MRDVRCVSASKRGRPGMKPRILVTGSSGLIGSALVPVLCEAGYLVTCLDLRGNGPARGDIRVLRNVEAAMVGCAGVVHLAAVSRVAHGETDPAGCWETNVGGTSTLLDAARSFGTPWVVYASSREVYGHTGALVVAEDHPVSPVNTYGRSKVAAEQLVGTSGVRHAILRFSNVYGGVADHHDRVVPSFARAAIDDAPLVVNGREHAFDFTHIDDVASGIAVVVDCLQRGAVLPPTHLVTGTSTTLGNLARLAVELARSSSRIVDGPPRTFDVARFHGSPDRAERVLRWRAKVPLREGLARFIDDVKRV